MAKKKTTTKQTTPTGKVSIKILVSCSGNHPVTKQGFSFVAGQIVNVDKELAAGLGGNAEPALNSK